MTDETPRPPVPAGRTPLTDDALQDLARTWTTDVADANARDHAELETWKNEHRKWNSFDYERRRTPWRESKDGYDPLRLMDRLRDALLRRWLGLPPKKY